MAEAGEDGRAPLLPAYPEKAQRTVVALLLFSLCFTSNVIISLLFPVRAKGLRAHGRSSCFRVCCQPYLSPAPAGFAATRAARLIPRAAVCTRSPDRAGIYARFHRLHLLRILVVNPPLLSSMRNLRPAVSPPPPPPFLPSRVQQE